MSRFRDRLIHGYDRIHWGEVWRVATERLPRLAPQIQALLDEMNAEAEKAAADSAIEPEG